MSNFLIGLQSVVSWYALPLIASGVALGLIFGAIPGLTATLAVALILPFTFGLPPVIGQVTLIGAFVGGISGGLVSATLLGIPGTPSSIATTFDAFPLAKKGQPIKALKTGIISSFIGGIISGMILVVASTQLAKIALSFGPYEYFMLAIFGLTVIVSLGEDSWVRSFISAIFGLTITLFGMDPVDGVPRFTFGFTRMQTGFNLIPTLLGLFVFSQLFSEIEKISERYIFKAKEKMDSFRFGLREIKNNWLNFIRSSLIGTGLGILPGVGGAIANFVCYDQAKKASNKPESFGEGAIEGIIASETGNNATTGGALVPMLTLGIPGDTVTAVLLGGLMIHGIQPGPLLFVEEVELIYGIFAGFFIANFFMLIIQYVFGIKLFTTVGCYAINCQIFDVWVLFLFGLIGYGMKKYGYPIPPAVLGFILGPIAEKNLRLALMHSGGSYLPFFTRPISLIMFCATIFSIFISLRGVAKFSRKGN